MKSIDFIPEREAARLLDYHPRYFRAMVKERKLPIDFTTIFGRKYQYRKDQVLEILLSNSTILKTA